MLHLLDRLVEQSGHTGTLDLDRFLHLVRNTVRKNIDVFCVEWLGSLQWILHIRLRFLLWLFVFSPLTKLENREWFSCYSLLVYTNEGMGEATLQRK